MFFSVCFPHLNFSLSEMNYALVAGISPDEPHNYCSKTEVMNVNGTTKICHSNANYPENVELIIGGSFLKNKLIVACGGGSEGYTTSACYSMTNDFKWTNFGNLTNPTASAASAIVKNGLWVTGRFSLKLSSLV